MKFAPAAAFGMLCAVLLALGMGCSPVVPPPPAATQAPQALPTLEKGGPCDGPAIAHLRVDRTTQGPDTGSTTFVAGGRVCFRITSGGEGKHAAAAARLTLDNSIEVAEPSDFNGQAVSLTASVLGLATGDHELHLRVTSKPETFVDVEVVDVDDVAGLATGGATVTGTVGSAGGVVSADGAAGLVSVEPGALSSDVTIQISSLAAAVLAAPTPADLVIVGGAELGPDNTVFSTPALVIVPLTTRATPGRRLTPLVYDPAQAAWVRSVASTGEHMPGFVTPDGAHGAFLVEHFSSHALGLPPPLPEIDTDRIGTVGTVTHECLPNLSFGVWDGPPLSGTPGCLFGLPAAAFCDEGFRRGVYADVFEQILLRPEVGDGPAQTAAVDQIIASIKNDVAEGTDAAWSHLLQEEHFDRVLRKLWGWAENKPPTFKHTTFANVRKRYGAVSTALAVVSVGAQIDEGAASVELLWALSQGADLTRIDTMRQYLTTAGLDADPAIKHGFEEAAARIESRHAAQTNKLVEAFEKAKEKGVVTVAALLEAGWSVALPTYGVNWLVRTKRLTPTAGGKLLGAVGVAADLWLGNWSTHRKQSAACALSTLYKRGLVLADVELENGVGLAELKYIAFAELARTARSIAAGDDLGFLSMHWVLYQATTPLVGDTRAAEIEFWKDALETARQGLEAITAKKYALDTEPMATTLDDAKPSLGFSCQSNSSITKNSCGSAYVSCYSGPEGSWFWTYGVAPSDCRATFTITAPSSGEQPLYAEYLAFCDQSDSVEYGIEDDFKTTKANVNQWASTLTPRTSSLGSFHFTSGQSYKVYVSDYYPPGYQSTPPACQAIGGAHHININIDRITFVAQAKPAVSLVATDKEAIHEDGTSVFAWPFYTHTWKRVEGSPFHHCSDATADDWNTTLGGGDAEITFGPMKLRAPISGTVVFAGESSADKGRGHQVIIESALVPGFFVGYAHLQPFDGSQLKGHFVNAGDALDVAVGDTGLDPATTGGYAHLHVSAWRRVLDTDTRSRVLNGRSPAGYSEACGVSKYAAPFKLSQDW